MTAEQARRVHAGDEIAAIVGGREVRCLVLGVDTRGIAAPYFRLTPIDDVPESVDQDIRNGRTSYHLCSLPPMAAQIELR